MQTYPAVVTTRVIVPIRSVCLRCSSDWVRLIDTVCVAAAYLSRHYHASGRILDLFDAVAVALRSLLPWLKARIFWRSSPRMSYYVSALMLPGLECGASCNSVEVPVTVVLEQCSQADRDGKKLREIVGPRYVRAYRTGQREQIQQ